MKHIKPYSVMESYTEAMGSETSPERLSEILFGTSSVLAAEIAASNPNMPISALIKAKDHEWVSVRNGLARNPAVPLSILDELSHDNHHLVRFAVANNPRTPLNALIRLTQDPVEAIRPAALENPNMPEDLTDWALGVDDSWI